jgi:hypothetical protein
MSDERVQPKEPLLRHYVTRKSSICHSGSLMPLSIER